MTDDLEAARGELQAAHAAAEDAEDAERRWLQDAVRPLLEPLRQEYERFRARIEEQVEVAKEDLEQRIEVTRLQLETTTGASAEEVQRVVTERLEEVRREFTAAARALQEAVGEHHTAIDALKGIIGSAAGEHAAQVAEVQKSLEALASVVINNQQVALERLSSLEEGGSELQHVTEALHQALSTMEGRLDSALQAAAQERTRLSQALVALADHSEQARSRLDVLDERSTAAATAASLAEAKDAVLERAIEVRHGVRSDVAELVAVEREHVDSELTGLRQGLEKTAARLEELAATSALDHRRVRTIQVRLAMAVVASAVLAGAVLVMMLLR